MISAVCRRISLAILFLRFFVCFLSLAPPSLSLTALCLSISLSISPSLLVWVLSSFLRFPPSDLCLQCCIHSLTLCRLAFRLAICKKNERPEIPGDTMPSLRTLIERCWDGKSFSYHVRLQKHALAPIYLYVDWPCFDNRSFSVFLKVSLRNVLLSKR